jgi:hypothetical protein
MVVELSMCCRVTQPTKEQVRAYMATRERADRPPPAPEDIRRQLGWQLVPAGPACAVVAFCVLPAGPSQAGAQSSFESCLDPAREPGTCSRMNPNCPLRSQLAAWPARRNAGLGV